MTCSVEDCDRRVFRQGLCRGHWQRKRDGRPVSGELRPRGRGPAGTFRDAVLDLLDLKTTDRRGWRLAWKRIETAGLRRWGGKGGSATK